MNRNLSKHDLCSNCSYDFSSYVLKINDNAKDYMKLSNTGGRGHRHTTKGNKLLQKIAPQIKRLKKKLKCTKYKMNPHMKGI
jgi:hypothetical protein